MSRNNGFENETAAGLNPVALCSRRLVHPAIGSLANLRGESPDLYQALCEAPMIPGCVAQFYSPALEQTTVDTAVRMRAGFPGAIEAVRWHPHLAGYLLSPFEQFSKARAAHCAAHCAFQDIMRRDSHMFKVEFRSGDLYLWDNFRILHGREHTLEVLRLALGQTVIEQVVSDEYCEVKTEWLKQYVNKYWLVQALTVQLNDLATLIKAQLGDRIASIVAR